jgi:dTDP-4-amino-4,6-dideoxygalactose transaminase
VRFNLDDCGTYRKKVEAALMRAVKKNNFILGENVREFESKWATANGASFCVGVGNGTDAIRIALLSAGIGPGDEVISPAFNVSYTALAVVSVGAKNVYVDVNPDTMLMDLVQTERAINNKTRAIIPVHLFGQMVNMLKLSDLAARYGVIVIEDAAQAHGALYDHASPGQYSDAAAFSFYPTKNLGAWGEAGGIVTNLPILASRARLLRDGGRIDRYIHFLPGLNSCLDEIQAAVLLAKLPHLWRSNEIRRRNAAKYIAGLTGVGDIRCPWTPKEVAHVWHLFVIRTKERDALMEHLKEQDIPSLIHYPVIIPHQPFAIMDAQGQGPWPVAEQTAREVLSLPMHPQLTAAEIQHVVTEVRRYYA